MQGASNTTTISTALTSGTAQSVALTVSGVPTGATATFSPTSVTAGGSSTLTLAAGHGRARHVLGDGHRHGGVGDAFDDGELHRDGGRAQRLRHHGQPEQRQRRAGTERHDLDRHQPHVGQRADGGADGLGCADRRDGDVQPDERDRGRQARC